MAINYVKARAKHWTKTAAEWTSTNPILLTGEIGIESDTKWSKVGDGSTAWNSLEYFTRPPEATFTVSVYQPSTAVWVDVDVQTIQASTTQPTDGSLWIDLNN